MSSTLFVNDVTLTDAAWFNDVDTLAYNLLASVTGTNTITAVGPTSMTVYTAGQRFLLVPANVNSGATTLNINSLGAKNIFANGVALVGGELQLLRIYELIYDGTQFQLTSSGNGSTVLDSIFTIVDNLDQTKKAQFQASGITTATTRTLTIQDKNITIAGLALADGGTNAVLTASNGGVVYSTGSAMAILSGTATAGQILRSGSSAAPSWSTATYPSTISSGQILRASSSNVIAASTATFADTYSDQNVLFASAANTVSGSSKLTHTSSASAAGLFVTESAVAGTASLFVIASDSGSGNASLIVRASGSSAYSFVEIGTGSLSWVVDSADTSQMYFGNSTGLSTKRVIFGGDGKVYKTVDNTTASAANMFINTGSSPAGQILRSTSSLKYKKDVEDIETAIYDKVLQLQPIKYKSTCEADRKDWTWYGLGAETVAEIDPRLVHWTINKETGEQEPEGVQYQTISVLLVGLVKKQDAKIKDLEERLSRLENAR